MVPLKSQIPGANEIADFIPIVPGTQAYRVVHYRPLPVDPGFIPIPYIERATVTGVTMFYKCTTVTARTMSTYPSMDVSWKVRLLVEPYTSSPCSDVVKLDPIIEQKVEEMTMSLESFQLNYYNNLTLLRYELRRLEDQQTVPAKFTKT